MCEYSKKSKIRKEKIVERDIGREREWEGESDERCKVETHVPVFYFLSIVACGQFCTTSEWEKESPAILRVYHIYITGHLYAARSVQTDCFWYTFSLAALLHYPMIVNI